MIPGIDHVTIPCHILANERCQAVESRHLSRKNELAVMYDGKFQLYAKVCLNLLK